MGNMHFASLIGFISLALLAAGGPIGHGINNGTATKALNQIFDGQLDAPWELNIISQPATNLDLHLFRNYIYEIHAGSKSWIYHIEHGVAYPSHPDEFPASRVDPSILTPGAQQLGYHDGEDHSPGRDFESTCTADKALGKLFGVAKKATLIPVVVPEVQTASDLADAFEAVVRDISAVSQKQKHTVVLTTLSVGPEGEFSELERLHNAMQQLMDMDVVIVVSAGKLNGAAVDQYPQAWASDSFPLIVAGSVDVNGVKTPPLPDGVRISTYAVGQNVVCFAGVGGPPTMFSYPAFAAPQVGGQIAIWLSYDTPPIDLSHGRVARNMRDYVETHPDAGWIRPGGRRVLYNGVSEGINPPFKKCAGLVGNMYVERETARKAIVEDFCIQVPHQSFEKRYNQGSMEDLVLSIQYDGILPPLDNTVTPAGCVRFLLGELTDGCDAAGNPNNWKGGGIATLTGVTYLVKPMAERQPANVARLGICRRGINGLRDNEYMVIGRGWLSSDAGQAFYQFLFDHCGLQLDSWHFIYYLDEDGREWSVRFNTDEEIPPSWVTEAALQFGAPDDFDCDECIGSDCS